MPDRVQALEEQVLDLRGQLARSEQRLKQEVNRAVESALKTFSIQAGQNAVISGTGRNITIGFKPGAPPVLQATAVCNSDGTITITWNTVGGT